MLSPERNENTQVVVDSLQLFSLPLIVAQEVSVLAGMDVLVDLQQEPLTELKGLKKTWSRSHWVGGAGRTWETLGADHTPVGTAPSAATHTRGTE